MTRTSRWCTRTATGISNLHRRSLPDAADASRAFALVREKSFDPDAGVWPSDSWPSLRLDAGMTVGSDGGHGPIRYRVSAVEPDRLRFDLHPEIATGHHEFRVHGAAIEHELVVQRPGPLLRWLVIPQHDALIEDLFDNVEDKLRDPNASPRARRWTRGVRLRRWLMTHVPKRAARRKATGGAQGGDHNDGTGQSPTEVSSRAV